MRWSLAACCALTAAAGAVYALDPGRFSPTAAPRGAPQVPSPRSVASNPSVAAASASTPASASTSTVAAAPSVTPAAPPTPSVANAEPETPANESDAFAELEVEGDLPIYVLRSADGGAPRTIFLTGSCTHPLTYTTAFRGAARAHGGLVALQGDQPCKGDPLLRRWSPDTIATSARIDAALRAAGATDTDTGELTLMGYSQGAERAEWLARRFPAKYTRFVLMAGPVVPSPARLAGARAVATLAGYGDVRENMADGARRLRRAKIPASYFELPGVHHGELSPAVDEVVARAFDWLDASASADATAIREPTRAQASHPRGARPKRGHAR